MPYKIITLIIDSPNGTESRRFTVVDNNTHAAYVVSYPEPRPLKIGPVRAFIAQQLDTNPDAIYCSQAVLSALGGKQ